VFDSYDIPEWSGIIIIVCTEVKTDDNFLTNVHPGQLDVHIGIDQSFVDYQFISTHVLLIELRT
jgi:hypothetical protein